MHCDFVHSAQIGKRREMSAIRVFPVLLYSALGLGLTALSPSAVATSPRIVIEHVSGHRAGTAEAAAIARWLDSIPDADRRTMELGTITVQQRRPPSDAWASAVVAPPAPLPASGAAGEKITITNELPGGFVETWTFQWVAGEGGGGWKQTDYETHAPIVQPDRPNEL